MPDDITPAEQRVLKVLLGYVPTELETLERALAALREYGAEQRAAGFAEGRIAMLPVMDTEGSNDR